MNNHKSATRNPEGPAALGCNIHFSACSDENFKCFPFHYISSQDNDLLESTEERYIRMIKPVLNNM